MDRCAASGQQTSLQLPLSRLGKVPNSVSAPEGTQCAVKGVDALERFLARRAAR